MIDEMTVCWLFCRAHGLQTVIQLMGEKELFEYYVDDYKVHQIDWTPQKAALVLESWQRKFSQVCTPIMIRN